MFGCVAEVGAETQAFMVIDVVVYILLFDANLVQGHDPIPNVVAVEEERVHVVLVLMPAAPVRWHALVEIPDPLEVALRPFKLLQHSFRRLTVELSRNGQRGGRTKQGNTNEGTKQDRQARCRLE